MELAELYRRAVRSWQLRVAAVGADQWAARTPCAQWDVRALVNHVVGEDWWTRPLVEGETIEQVGDRLDGDLLGDDPKSSAEAAAADALDAMVERLPERGIVHLSFGDVGIEEYCRQLLADHTIHTWDLAAATGQDRTVDPELVAAVGPWFDQAEQLMRDAGLIGAQVHSGTDPQSQLLARFGRDPSW